MSIRHLNKSNPVELSRLYQIQKAAYLVEAGILGVEASQFYPLKETEKELRDSTDEIFISCLEEDIVGAIFLEHLESAIVISKLIVDPAFFRRGVARGLLEYILKMFPSEEVWVGTGADNEPALQLYRSYQFQVFQEQIVEPNLKIVKLKRIPPR